MELTIKDAISAESMDEYDTFMAGVSDSSFLSREHKDGVIIVNEHNSEDHSVFKTGKFKASELAAAYFEQEREMAIKMGLITEDEEF
ncbi:hypothetical protein QM012_002291 [Aureobasidium pullulans]|uniref:Phage protein n=1 Tax=Aureobasidium pullulans TaxID=5580 RepID=A0ABR0TBH9_AURPU